jgi:hypothetical protein
VREVERRCPYCKGRIYTDAGCQNCKVGATYPKPAAEPVLVVYDVERNQRLRQEGDARCKAPEPVISDEMVDRWQALDRELRKTHFYTDVTCYEYERERLRRWLTSVRK